MSRLAICLVLLATLSGRPAAAAWNECGATGLAGTWLVRKITIPDSGVRSMNVRLELSAPLTGLSDGGNWHLFGGIWILTADSLSHWSHAFLDIDSALGPPFVRATFGGQGVIEREAPSTDLASGAQGAYFVSPDIHPGTYYVIAFGNGAGTYTASLNYAGSPLACEAIDAPGTLYDFDAADFKGGDQVLTPGNGHVRGGRLAFTNTRRFMVGGLMVYEPLPFPPATLILRYDGREEAYTNFIDQIGTARDWGLTVDYTGKSNTIMLQALGFDLPV